MDVLSRLKKELWIVRDPARAKRLSRYFKTGPGEYGAGDRFLGVTAPVQRQIARRYVPRLGPRDLRRLLLSPFHEHRFTALVALVFQYHRAGEQERSRISRFYLQNRRRINNWDLVDVSAPHLLGDYLLKNDRVILYRLVRSERLWDRRMAIVATLRLVAAEQFADALNLARLALRDREDLIHKAAGWVLREVGKRSLAVEERFLGKYARRMPRTMLRYALERLPSAKRKRYLRMTAD